MTVRQGVTAMVSEGRLVRVQGSGTFVAEQKLEQELNLSFSESSSRRGIEVSSTLLECTQLPANSGLAGKLDLHVGQQLYRVIRLRFGNKVPMVLERSYFPSHRCPGLEQYDLENRSIYHLLVSEYGISFSFMRQSLEPVAADETEARVLQVPFGSPLMLVERVTFDAHGTPIEYAKDIYRGDKSRFVSEMPFGERGVVGESDAHRE